MACRVWGELAAVHHLAEELGGSVNQADNGGATPLWIAAYNDHLAVVQWLAGNGVQHFVPAGRGVAGRLPQSLAYPFPSSPAIPRLHDKPYGIDNTVMHWVSVTFFSTDRGL